MQNDKPKETNIYERARAAAETAARLAGDLIAREAGKINPSEIREKGINDIVTAVDEEAQRIIVQHLLAEFPDHKVLAEEGLDMRETDSGHVTNSDPDEFLWIIDPVDGTTNFTRSIPPYAVSIALSHGGRLVVGVVLDVAHDEMFSAVSGEGLRIDGVQSKVRPTKTLAESIITTGFPYRAFGHVDEYLAVLKEFMRSSRAVRRPGSASVDLAWVATGRFDGFFETGLNPWDVAAGIVLVREGGGHVTDYKGNPNPTFDHQIVASNGLIHDEMLTLVEPMRHISD